MLRKTMLTLGSILIAVALVACDGVSQAPEATANQPKTPTPVPPTLAPTGLPSDFAEFDIAPEEFGAGFKSSPDDAATMASAASAYDAFFSDTQVLAFARDIPAEVISIYIGLLLDDAARESLDKTLDGLTPKDLAPEGTTGDSFMMDEIGDNAVGFTGGDGAGWRVDTLMYRDGMVFVYVGVTFEDGVTPAAATEEILALIGKHIEPIHAAQ